MLHSPDIICLSWKDSDPYLKKSDLKKKVFLQWLQMLRCLRCIVQLTPSISCVCITVALASASLLWKVEQESCPQRVYEPSANASSRRHCLSSRKARLILRSLTAFYCSSNDAQSVCLCGGWKLQLNLSSVENETLLTPKFQTLCLNGV